MLPLSADGPSVWTSSGWIGTEGSGVLRSTFVCRAPPVCGEGARWRSQCVTVSVSFRLVRIRS